MGHPAPSALKSGNNGAVGMSARFSKIGAFVLVLCCLSGCTPAAKQTGPETATKPVGPNLPPLPAQSPSAKISRSTDESCRVPALVELWRQRVDAPLTDLPIGPGDVIDISVPEIEELQHQKVRVSAQGQIELPLIGSVEAAGLGENELHDALVQKLKVYMKTPRVELFVENYRSRGVAIMGAVQKPGYYDLADEQESVEAMMGLAGGLSPAAAQKVILRDLGAVWKPYWDVGRMLLFAPEYPRCSEKRATLTFSGASAPWPLRRRTFWRLVPGSRGRVCSADPRLSRPGKRRPFAKSHSGSCRRAWLEGRSDCEPGAERRCTNSRPRFC